MESGDGLRSKTQLRIDKRRLPITLVSFLALPYPKSLVLNHPQQLDQNRHHEVRRRHHHHRRPRRLQPGLLNSRQLHRYLLRIPRQLSCKSDLVILYLRLSNTLIARSRHCS